MRKDFLDDLPMWLSLVWSVIFGALLMWGRGDLRLWEYAVGGSFVIYPCLWCWHVSRKRGNINDRK